MEINQEIPQKGEVQFDPGYAVYGSGQQDAKGGLQSGTDVESVNLGFKTHTGVNFRSIEVVPSDLANETESKFQPPPGHVMRTSENSHFANILQQTQGEKCESLPVCRLEGGGNDKVNEMTGSDHPDIKLSSYASVTFDSSVGNHGNVPIDQKVDHCNSIIVPEQKPSNYDNAGVDVLARTCSSVTSEPQTVHYGDVTTELQATDHFSVPAGQHVSDHGNVTSVQQAGVYGNVTKEQCASNYDTAAASNLAGNYGNITTEQHGNDYNSVGTGEKNTPSNCVVEKEILGCRNAEANGSSECGANAMKYDMTSSQMKSESCDAHLFESQLYTDKKCESSFDRKVENGDCSLPPGNSLENKNEFETVPDADKQTGVVGHATGITVNNEQLDSDAPFPSVAEKHSPQSGAAGDKHGGEILSIGVVEIERKEDTMLDKDLQELRREVELKYANFSGDSQGNDDNNEDAAALKEQHVTKTEVNGSASDDAKPSDGKSDVILKEEPREAGQVAPRTRSARKAARRARKQISDMADDAALSDGGAADGVADAVPARTSCKCCNSKFATQEEFAHHVVMYFGIATPTVMFKCQSCCHCFDSLVDLKAHAREHDDGAPAPVLCMICDQPFKDRSLLAVHLASHECGDGDVPEMNEHAPGLNEAMDGNDSDNTIEAGDDVGASERSAISANALHTVDVPNPDIKLEPAEFQIPDDEEIEKMKQRKGRYKCKWCEKIYKGKTGLKKHLRFCSKDQPALKCKFCGKVFKEESNWRRHEGMHVGIRPHKCPLCDKAYSQRKHLRVHMASHGGGVAGGAKSKYACDQCGKAFSDNHGLKRHKMRHTDERPYQCSRCERRFREMSDLRMHEKYHDNIRPHKCPECEKAYVKKSHLRQHMKVHSGEKKFVCSYCDKAYHSAQSCKRHEMLHTGEKPYKCSYCEKGYTEAADRNYHELSHTGERPHACGQCDKRFLRKSHLNAHAATHRSERDYSCDKCGKRFTSVYGLRKHGQIHDGVKKYSCEYCGKMFRESRNLKVHLMTHTGEKPHACTECDKRFITAGELKMHFRIHTGEKPNTCEYCGMVFSQKGNLSRHLLRHTGDRPLKCEECGKGFIERQELKAHILNHAGMKPYKCEHCNLGFVRKHHLTKHYRTHTGVKPHCCEFCGKSFTERYNLQTHRVIHTGVKPHPCPFCPQGFIRKGHLKKHVKEAHPGKELDDSPNFYIERSPNKPLKEPIVFSQEDIMKTLPVKAFPQVEPSAPQVSNAQVLNAQVSSPAERSEPPKETDMTVYQEGPFRRPPYLPEVDLGPHGYPQLHPGMMQQYGAAAAAAANMLPVNTPEGLLNRLTEIHNNPAAYTHPNIFPL